MRPGNFGACLLTIALVLLLTGCRPSASKLTIAVIPRDTAEEIWVSEHGGAADAARESRLHIYWNGPSRDDDVEQQIALSERAVARHYYGLILSPNNSFALGNLIQRAVSSGIPVVITGSEIPIAPRPGLSFVLNDADTMGRLAAERTNEILKGKGDIAILGTDSLSPGSVQRSDAYENALHHIAPQINLAAKLAGSFSFGQAELASEQMIRANPRLSVIFALGIDETRGAVAAVHSMQREDRIRIIGCDQTLDLLFLLRRGDIDSLVVENTRAMGYRAVEEIVAEKHGGKAPPRVVIQPVLVDRENIDEPSIQEILSLRWSPQA